MIVKDITIAPKNHVIKKVTYTKVELLDTIMRAALIEGNLNPYNPAGDLRDQETISVKNLGGLISEKVIEDLMIKKIDETSTINAEIIESNFKEIESSEFQIDHKIRCENGCELDVETRSSFSYRTTCPENVINYAFQIIGPYTTANKGIEHPKDYYAFVFYCMNPENLKATIEEGEISLYFAGGASLDMLNNSRTNLKQRGATYKTLKPITDGFDAEIFLTEVFKGCM